MVFNFFKEVVENDEKFENLLSKKGERKLTSKQVLKILKEEAEFDEKFQEVLNYIEVLKKNPS